MANEKEDMVAVETKAPRRTRNAAKGAAQEEKQPDAMVGLVEESTAEEPVEKESMEIPRETEPNLEPLTKDDSSTEEIPKAEMYENEAQVDLEPPITTTEEETLPEEDIEDIKKASVEVFGEDDEESSPLPQAPVIDREVLNQTKAAEQQELAQKLSRASAISDEEDLLNRRLIEAGRATRRTLYNEDVIPLHDELQYESTSVIRKREYLTLAESYQTGKVLYGRVTGSCVYGSRLTAIVKYGSFFRVLIPFDAFTKLSKEDNEYIDQAKNMKDATERRQRLRIDQRISSEVDFIVRSIDEINGLAIGDRISAMNRQKLNFYFSRNRQGDFNIHQGQKAEARIVRATHNYLVAELYGMEFRLSAEDLARVHIPDVSEMFPTGSTAPVKITHLTREAAGKGQYRLSARISIKEGVEDRTKACFDFYNVGARVVGVVTGIESYGVFCRLEGNNGTLDALCHFSQSDFVSIPPVGSTVAILITGKNVEKMQITGNVTRVLKYA